MTTGENLKIIGFEEVFRDPHGVAKRIIAANSIFGLIDIEVRRVDDKMVVLWLSLEPWTPMAERGYPTEQVSITIWSDERITAVPFDASDRGWQHRIQCIPGRLDAIGQLCLWSEFDPRSLRWEWADGLLAFVTIVHRHLQAEEFFRRHQSWPSEDAPHGLGNHPVRTFAMSRIVHEGTS